MTYPGSNQPYQPQPYQPQRYQPPQPPKQNHRTRNILLGVAGGLAALIIVGIIGAAIGSAGKLTASGSTPPAASSPAASSPTPNQQLITKLKDTTGSDGNSLYSDLQRVGDNPLAMASQICGGSTSVSLPSTWSTSDKKAFLNAVTSTQCPGVTITLTGPQYTTAQQQAIDSAESYLSDGSGFSRYGLIQQLDSHYGAGFSRRLAVFAVDHVKVNWFHQAVISARGYLRSEPGWSYSGLVQQLHSTYGAGFTLAQAEYAAKKVGL